jgi:hypothetical protein
MSAGGRGGASGGGPAEPAPARPQGPGGLCPACRHVRRLVNDRGSTFYLCQLARVDPSLPRYPAQPRLVCRGYER